MKKRFAGIFPLLLPLILSGCNAIGEKNESLTYVYFAAAALSFVLLLGCLCLVRKNRAWFVTLFASVLGVNIGYSLLSVSTCLEMALWANRLSYLGSVFLPLSMLMILLNVTATRAPSWLPWALGALAVVLLLIAASPGVLPIYYKEVSFAVIDGTSTLQKVYGPLHPLYLVYLLGYFAAMVWLILYARAKKTIESTSHAVILLIAVLVNLGVWFLEQLVKIEFEMLSVSYIISELFLLSVHLVMKEYQRLKNLVRQAQSLPEQGRGESVLESPVACGDFPSESTEAFVTGLGTLTPTEKAIFDAYVARATTKEVMAALNIKETTLKYHNRNLYGKLGVSSRKELLELHKYLQSVKKNME